MIVGSHIDAVPDGGWLDGVLGLMTALETVRQLARAGTQAADRRSVRRLGGRGGGAVRPQPARLLSVRRDARARRGPRPARCGGRRVGRRAGRMRSRSRQRARRRGTAEGRRRVSRAPYRAGPRTARRRPAGLRRERDGRGRAAPDDVHRSGGPRRVDADAAAPGLARCRSARGARRTAERDQPWRRRHRRADAVRSRRHHRRRRQHRDAARPAPPRPETSSPRCSPRRSRRAASAAEEFNCTVEQRDVFRATPTPFDATLVELARRSVQEAGGDAGEPIPSGPLHDATEIGRVVPTAMIFAQSDPPISHASIEDSPERALIVAIDAYGRTVSSVLARAGEMTSKGAD